MCIILCFGNLLISLAAFAQICLNDFNSLLRQLIHICSLKDLIEIGKNIITTGEMANVQVSNLKFECRIYCIMTLC